MAGCASGSYAGSGSGYGCASGGKTCCGCGGEADCGGSARSSSAATGGESGCWGRCGSGGCGKWSCGLAGCTSAGSAATSCGCAVARGDRRSSARRDADRNGTARWGPSGSNSSTCVDASTGWATDANASGRASDSAWAVAVRSRAGKRGGDGRGWRFVQRVGESSCANAGSRAAGSAAGACASNTAG